MLRNYFKTAIRNLLRFKTITAINVIGLAISLAAAFIVILFVIKETSFDAYNEKLSDIYAITRQDKFFNSKDFRVPGMLANEMKRNLPEINKIARIFGVRGVIKVNDKEFTDEVCKSADSDIFDILTLPLIYGEKETVFGNRNSAVISEKTSLKYFGNRNPVGEQLTFKNKNCVIDLIVSGVMKDIPEESTFKADLLLPIGFVEDYNKALYGNLEALESWNFSICRTYLLLNPHTVIPEFNNKIELLTKNYTKDICSLFPLKDVYLKSGEIQGGGITQGSIEKVYIYSAVAALMLLMACINYIILSTGTANLRTKEIGIRKVIGGTRSNIIMQVMSESVLIASISVPIAIVLVEIALPVISNLLGKELKAGYFHNIKYVALLFVIAIIVGIISGSYISLFLSRYNPVDIIRNKLNAGKKRTLFRKVLIGFQMTIFTGLIFTSLIVYKQLHYLYNKDFGFNKDDVLVVYGRHEILNGRFEAFQNILKSNPNIADVAGGMDVPGTESRMATLEPKRDDPNEKVTLEGMEIEGDFLKTMKMEIITGRDFSNDNEEKWKHELILNETAVKKLGIKNPIGEKIGGSEVVGVVKDFNFHSLYEVIPPMEIRKGTKYTSYIVVKVKTTDIPGTVQFVKEKSKEFNDGKVMECEFFDERIAQLYQDDEKFGKVIAFFTGLSIFVAGLGLFGMSLFIVQQRIKEISMRKVLGASYWDIMLIISKEFILTAIIACIITIPAAIYFISDWMAHFAYKTEVDAALILFAAFCAILVTIITTGAKVYQAARINPINNLRQE